MPLNPSGAISLGGPSSGQSIAVELGLSPTATISLNQTNVRAFAGVPSGTIIMPTDFWGKSTFTNTQLGIFGYGRTPTVRSMTNLVSNTGIVAADTAGVGTARFFLAAATYGGDKAIFGYGDNGSNVSMTNLVSNTGVVASDTPGVGTARRQLAALGYGGDKAIFGFGSNGSCSNLVSNTGVVATDTPFVGTNRTGSSGAGYGSDKGLFIYGLIGVSPALSRLNTTNYVSNTGVIASDTPSASSGRDNAGGARYGGDKAIFGYGTTTAPASVQTNVSNLVSNTGVVATDTPGVGLARAEVAATGYGGDKAIFGYGFTSPPITQQRVTNLVSNTGVVAANNPGIGTARRGLAAAGYSF